MSDTDSQYSTVRSIEGLLDAGQAATVGRSNPVDVPDKLFKTSQHSNGVGKRTTLPRVQTAAGGVASARRLQSPPASLHFTTLPLPPAIDDIKRQHRRSTSLIDEKKSTGDDHHRHPSCSTADDDIFPARAGSPVQMSLSRSFRLRLAHHHNLDQRRPSDTSFDADEVR
jgi:hypothetical protein